MIRVKLNLVILSKDAELISLIGICVIYAEHCVEEQTKVGT